MTEVSQPSLASPAPTTDDSCLRSLVERATRPARLPFLYVHREIEWSAKTSGLMQLSGHAKAVKVSTPPRSPSASSDTRWLRHKLHTRLHAGKSKSAIQHDDPSRDAVCWSLLSSLHTWLIPASVVG